MTRRAAVVSLKEVDPQSLSLSMNPEFLAITQKARQELKAGKKLSVEDMKRDFLQ